MANHCQLIQAIPEPELVCALLKFSAERMTEDLSEACCTHYALDAILKAMDLYSMKADNCSL